MISVYINDKVAHITIDSGATVSFIVESEAKRLELKIEKASQLARQADGCTMMKVIGEVHGKATRGAAQFVIHALVVPNLDGAKILAGINFLIENKISQEPCKHRVVVENKFTIEETPAAFAHPPDLPYSKTVKIKKIKAVFNGEYFDITLPKEYPSNSKVVVDSSDQANIDKDWLFQEVEAVNRTLKIVNHSGDVKTLGKNKDTAVIKIRPLVDISTEVSQPNIQVNAKSKLNYWVKEDTKTFVLKTNGNAMIQKHSIDKKTVGAVDPSEYLHIYNLHRTRDYDRRAVF